MAIMENTESTNGGKNAKKRKLLYAVGLNIN